MKDEITKVWLRNSSRIFLSSGRISLSMKKNSTEATMLEMQKDYHED